MFISEPCLMRLLCNFQTLKPLFLKRRFCRLVSVCLTASNFYNELGAPEETLFPIQKRIAQYTECESVVVCRYIQRLQRHSGSPI